MAFNQRFLNCTEGTFFVVPLRDGEFVRGVISRLNRVGIALCYFFGLPLSSPQNVFTSEDLRPENAVLCGQTGDSGLRKGAWKIVGQVENWNRDKWPIPALVRGDSEATFISHHYSDELVLLSEKRLPPNAATPAGSWKDGVMGYGFVELRLTKLFKSRRITPQ